MAEPLDTTEVAAVFGRAVGTYDTVIPFFSEFGERLAEFAEVQEGEQVLDLGCGKGAALFPAAARAGGSGHVVGVDLAGEMVEWVAAEIDRRQVPNASVKQMDAQNLELPDDSFDVVLSNFVLHLLPDPAEAATSAARVLKPGGRLAASVPGGAGPMWAFLGPIYREYAARVTGPVVAPYRPEFNLDRVATDSGWDIIKSADVTVTFRLRDEREWWEWAWSHGMRAFFEVLPPDALDEMRERCFHHLRQNITPEGLTMDQEAHMIVARRSR